MTCKQATLRIFIKWMLNKDIDEPRKSFFFSPIVSMKLKSVWLTFSFIFLKSICAFKIIS